MKIPRTRICPHHKSPFDFVYDAFTGRYKTIIAKANRSGGKTTDFAILDVLHSLAFNGCEIATLGAIQSQANRCYGYVKEFTNANPEFRQHLKSSLMKKTSFDTGSTIEILTATISGVNSPHPQKLFMDEVELINWFIIQQAFNMVKSKGEITGQTVLGSTQKFTQGPMERLINDARLSERIGVYEWCIWEVMEKPKPERYAEFHEIFGTDLPENFTQCDGFYNWDDLIDQYTRIDREIWETELVCNKPQTGGLVYPRFNDELNLEKNFVLDPSKVYLFEDYGYAISHPDVVLFAQVDIERQRVVIFDELYLTLKNTDEIFETVNRKLQDYGLSIKTIKGWIGDPHGLTETKDRYNKGCPMLEKVTKEENNDAAELYIVRNGIAIVRNFVDKAWLRFTPNVTEFRNEMMSYRKVKKSDGTYKDEAEKMNDHGPDATRYGLIRLFPVMGFASFDVVRQRITVPSSIAPTVRPITYGLRQKVF